MTAMLLLVRYLFSKLSVQCWTPAAGIAAWMAGLGWRSLAVAAIAALVCLALFEGDPNETPQPLRDLNRQLKELTALVDSFSDKDDEDA